MTPIRPPFTAESARPKVQAAEDAWDSRDPESVSLAYTEDSKWRNRSGFGTNERDLFFPERPPATAVPR